MGRRHAALIVLQLCSPSLACLPEDLYLNALWLLEFILGLHLVKRSALLSLFFSTFQLPGISSAFCNLRESPSRKVGADHRTQFFTDVLLK